mgnify:CR=1 FL=1
MGMPTILAHVAVDRLQEIEAAMCGYTCTHLECEEHGAGFCTLSPVELVRDFIEVCKDIHKNG